MNGAQRLKFPGDGWPGSKCHRRRMAGLFLTGDQCLAAGQGYSSPCLVGAAEKSVFDPRIKSEDGPFSIARFSAGNGTPPAPGRFRPPAVFQYAEQIGNAVRRDRRHYLGQRHRQFLLAFQYPRQRTHRNRPHPLDPIPNSSQSPTQLAGLTHARTGPRGGSRPSRAPSRRYQASIP